MEKMEQRDAPQALQPAIEIRAGGADKRIVGYAAVFYDGSDDTQFRLWDGAVERIDRGAFDRAMSERQDVVALFNHDPNVPLGRRAAGTLALRVDDVGLHYTIDVGQSQQANDVRDSVERGDVRGSSFSFYVRSEKWDEDKDGDVRTLLSVDVVDVGPVVFPAYGGTSAEAASCRSARLSWHAWAIRRRIQEAIIRGQKFGIDI